MVHPLSVLIAADLIAADLKQKPQGHERRPVPSAAAASSAPAPASAAAPAAALTAAAPAAAAAAATEAQGPCLKRPPPRGGASDALGHHPKLRHPTSCPEVQPKRQSRARRHRQKKGLILKRRHRGKTSSAPHPKQASNANAVGHHPHLQHPMWQSRARRHRL